MPDVQTAWKFLQDSDPVAGADQVRAAILDVARQIEQKLSGEYPLVLAVMVGAVVFAGQLLPLLRFPLDFDYIHASRYGSQTQGTGVQWRVSPPDLVQGRTVLIVDDILDRGDTMHAIRSRLLELGAKAFYCAVLVEKALQKPKPASADFVGLTIPDRFVFGCGMDAKGYWRNLPEIRAMKEG